jgi:hypothetical protein
VPPTHATAVEYKNRHADDAGAPAVLRPRIVTVQQFIMEKTKTEYLGVNEVESEVWTGTYQPHVFTFL